MAHLTLLGCRLSWLGWRSVSMNALAVTSSLLARYISKLLHNSMLDVSLRHLSLLRSRQSQTLIGAAPLPVCLKAW
jgi:hypothetical protein